MPQRPVGGVLPEYHRHLHPDQPSGATGTNVLPLQDAIDYLSTLTGQTILLDKNSLEEAQVTYETPINFAPRGLRC